MIDVACAADDTYVPHAATMLHSLLTENPASTVRVHFLHPPELSAESGCLLMRLVSELGASLSLHEISHSLVRDLPRIERIPQVMWFRLFLPDLLPAATSRVLYLDCDTLVTDRLEALWQLDLCGRSVGAVDNVLPREMRQRPHELGLESNSYFNSGVLLLDLDRWRDRGVGGRILEVAREKAGLLVLPDQDALNIVLSADRFALHPRWNCQNSFFHFRHAEQVLGREELRVARESPAIVHFEGPAMAKPWHYLSKHPYRERYFVHRAETPWPLDELDGTSWLNRVLRPLPPATTALVLRGKHRVETSLQRALRTHR